MKERSAWFVRSMGDADTHRGVYSPATRSVHAMCGIEFQPVPVSWPPKLGPLPGNPPDPQQVCPQCHNGRVPTAGSPVSTERTAHTIVAVHELDKTDI